MRNLECLHLGPVADNIPRSVTETRLKQLELVGRGGRAEVYRGMLAGERGVQRPVAIKRLRTELRGDAGANELFVNEARLAVQMQHPNVVHGLELARDADGYYL